MVLSARAQALPAPTGAAPTNKIAQNGQVIKCSFILWHSRSGFYIKDGDD